MSLYPTAPPDIQAIRLAHLRDALDEVQEAAAKRKGLGKRYRRAYNGFKYLSVALNAVSASTSAISVGCLASGVGVIVAIPLGAVSVFVAGASVGLDLTKSFLAKKAEKHSTLQRMAESHALTMASAQSRVLDDGQISDAEFVHIQGALTAWRSERRERSKKRKGE